MRPSRRRLRRRERQELFGASVGIAPQHEAENRLGMLAVCPPETLTHLRKDDGLVALSQPFPMRMMIGMR